jgi:DNA-binding HxlR family transcriptional regulator
MMTGAAGPAEMAHPRESAMNTVGDVLEAVARRGVLAVLRRLERGAQRHNDLLRATSMDGKQLSRALRQAMRANLVERYVDARKMPVTVRYRLTERGRKLVVALGRLADEIAVEPADGLDAAYSNPSYNT